MTKRSKRFALVLGVAAGATLAVFANAKTGKKAIEYVSKKTSDSKNGKLKREKLDDSETYYI